jgi:hypothetical protein
MPMIDVAATIAATRLLLSLVSPQIFPATRQKTAARRYTVEPFLELPTLSS